METHVLVIAPGEPLPEPGKMFKVVDIMTDEKLTLKVKRIDNLRWHSKNKNLIVEVTGSIRGR